MRLMAHPGFLDGQLRDSQAQDRAGCAVPGPGDCGLVLPERGLRRAPPDEVGVPVEQLITIDLTFIRLVRTCRLLDECEGVAEVGRERVFGGEGVVAGADLDGAVSACRADEFLDGPAGAVLDEAGDGEGSEDDREAGLDGVALAVVDRPGTQVSSGAGPGCARRTSAPRSFTTASP